MTKKQKLQKRLKSIEEELDKIGFDTPLNYGRGTQALGHAKQKRDELAKEKMDIKFKLEEL